MKTTLEDLPVTRAALKTFVQEIVDLHFKPLFKQLAEAHTRLDAIEANRRTTVARHAEMGMKFVATQFEAKIQGEIDAVNAKAAELSAKREAEKMERLFPVGFDQLSAVERANIYRRRAIEL